MKNSAARLMGDFKKGSKEAFEEVYNTYHLQLYYFVRKITGNPEEAEDITSETFVKLWQLCARFETLQNIKAFLFIAARNASLDYLRYLKRVAGDVRDFKYTAPQIDELEFER